MSTAAASSTEASAPANTATQPRFELIVVGDEILSGRRRDAHIPKVIELLGQRQLALSAVHIVGDERERIAARLREAFAGGSVVFCCGGIGATPDDHTRQAAAEALGVPLHMHPQARELILQRMQNTAREQGVAFEPDRADNVQRLQMAVFPRGAEIIPNPYNQIAGFSVGHVHFMPGFPVMAWPMIEWVLDTHYRQWQGRASHAERAVIVPGANEARLTPLMEQIEAQFPGVKVFSLPSVDHPRHGVHIELGVKGPADAVEPAFAHLVEQLAEEGLPATPIPAEPREAA